MIGAPPGAMLFSSSQPNSSGNRGVGRLVGTPPRRLRAGGCPDTAARGGLEQWCVGDPVLPVIAYALRDRDRCRNSSSPATVSRHSMSTPGRRATFYSAFHEMRPSRFLSKAVLLRYSWSRALRTLAPAALSVVWRIAAPALVAAGAAVWSRQRRRPAFAGLLSDSNCFEAVTPGRARGSSARRPCRS